MRLSTKGQYAVRAMVDLAYYSGSKPVVLQDIADREGISVHYLEQLFSKLRKKNIVKSIKGPGGGYILSKTPDKIKVGDVITAVEESLTPVACIEGVERCERIDKCVTFNLWKGLGDRIREFLNSITLMDLCNDAEDIYRKMK